MPRLPQPLATVQARTTARRTATSSLLPRLLLAAAPLALLPGCDSPACVFGPGGCDGTGGGAGGGPGAAGSAPATTLETGQWLDADGPSTVAMIPASGSTVHPSSVLAVEFDVSMSAESLTGAFVLVDTIFGTEVPLVEPPPMVANGRVALLAPSQPLAPGSIYQLGWVEGAEPADVVGRVGAFSGTIGSFDVQVTTTPRVLGTFPLDGDEAAGDLTDLFVLFDQPMDAASVTLASFKVEVGPGVPPEAEAPTPVVLPGAVPVPILQAWSWSLRDDDGERISLGATTEVRLTCSTALRSQAGETLEETVVTFQTGSLVAPRFVEKPFAPFDAIGLADLLSPAPLVEVELAEPAPVGGAPQTLGVAISGTSRSNPGAAIGLVRTVPVAEGEQLVGAGVEALGFVDSMGAPYLGDGDLTLVAWNARAGRLSQARSFRAFGSQAPAPVLLDTVPPAITELGPNGGTTDVFISDQRDLVLVGRATEPIAYVRVEALDPLGGPVVSNAFDPDGAGPLPLQDPAPVVMAGQAGLFLAQPAVIGAVDPQQPWTFDYQLFDRALNGSDVQLGVAFEQRGVLAAGPAATGAPTLTVDVFDAVGGAPIAGALVHVHDRTNDGVPPIAVGGPVATDGDGRAELAFGGTSAVVSVVADGYDLLTVVDAPTSSLQVLLHPTGALPAQALGEVRAPVTSGLDLGNAALTTLAADGRGLAPVTLTGPATLDSETAEFVRPFGPYALQAGELGVQTALVVVAGIPLAAFNGPTFLLGFGQRAPAPPLPAGNAPSPIRIDVPGPLALAPEEERVVDTGLLEVPFTVPVPGDGLPGWDSLVQAPGVLVEARSPGIPRPWIIGAGVSGGAGPGLWPFKAAWPGAFDVVSGPADDLGSAVLTGLCEPDVWVRLELVGDTGATGSARWSAAAAAPGGPVAPLPPFPVLVAGGPVGTAPPQAPPFSVRLRDPQPGSVDEVVRLRLLAANGRNWDLWRLGGAEAELTLWPLALVEEFEFPFLSGLELQAEARIVPGLDPTSLTWGQLERDVEGVARTPELPVFTP